MGDSRYSAIVGVVCLGGVVAFVEPLTEDWRPPTPEFSAPVSRSADSAVTIKGMRIAIHELQWENHSLRVSVDLRFVPDLEVERPRYYWFPRWQCVVILRFKDMYGVVMKETAAVRMPGLFFLELEQDRQTVSVNVPRGAYAIAAEYSSTRLMTHWVPLPSR